MNDNYLRAVGGGLGAGLAKKLGLPQPVPLRRYTPGEPIIDGPVAVFGTSPVTAALLNTLAEADLDACTEPGERLSAIIVDATDVRDVLGLDRIRHYLHDSLRGLARCGRVIIVGADDRPTSDAFDSSAVEQVAAQRGLEGLTRSLGKELRQGATANLVRLPDPGTSSAPDPFPTISFLLSGRSAYVDGQVLRLTGDSRWPIADVLNPSPLAGKTALVTGAARGIGNAIARALHRDGAHVLAVDIPSSGHALANLANDLRGMAVQADITAEETPLRLAEQLHRLGGLDILVHNAGITRDRLLVNLNPSQWASVLEVNLAAQLRLDDALLAPGGPLKADGRVVSVSSIAGLAGNRGQTNYATSKAGVAGMVAARAAQLGRRATYNAVAPGFIETEMTAKIPLATREAGRRLNSLSQGGQPHDVAEVIAFFAKPTTSALTGQVLRVCGQSLLGA